MTHLKEKLEKDVEIVKISRSNANDYVPRGGKRALEEERERRLL